MKAGKQIKQTTERLGGYISQPSDTGTATAEKQAAPKLPRDGGQRPSLSRPQRRARTCGWQDLGKGTAWR